ADLMAERYGARTVRPADHGAPLPVGVVGVPTPTADEVVYWLAGGRAVVPGDTLLGDGEGGVRVCPADWLDGDGVTDATVVALVEELRPLLGLPVERVLLSHGPPVLTDGLAALSRALDGYRAA
ncbi:MAG: MBL fold metallo-hydrolase, partial [Gaiella sp.]